MQTRHEAPQPDGFRLGGWGRLHLGLAVAALAVLLGFGSAVEYHRVEIAKVKLFQAIDRAALAAAAAIGATDGERVRSAKAHFAASHSGPAVVVPEGPSVTIAGGRIHIRAAATVPVTAARFSGREGIPVSVETEAVLPPAAPGRMVVLLDVGRSAEGYGAPLELRDVAGRLAALSGEDQGQDAVKVAVMRFSGNLAHAQLAQADGADAVRAVVLLTGAAGQAGTALARSCEIVKDGGALLIVVAFRVEDRERLEALRRCASGHRNYFAASDDFDLAGALAAVRRLLVQAANR